jgi:hypothetical protein
MERKSIHTNAPAADPKLKAKMAELKACAEALRSPTEFPGLFLTDPYYAFANVVEERWNERGYYEQNRGWFSPKNAGNGQ